MTLADLAGHPRLAVIEYSSFTHYHDHCWPIMEELQRRSLAVRCWTSRNEVEWAAKMPPSKLSRYDPLYWMVAGSVDYNRLPDHARVIYVEHGAGQVYPSDQGGIDRAESYSNGVLDRADLFLCPNVFVQQRRARNHPGARSVLVGWPKLDWHHTYATGWHDGVEQVVALAWHWDCHVCEETKTALPHYEPALLKLNLAVRQRGYRLVTTAHPRIAPRVRAQLGRLGIEWWESEDVLTHAAVLCADNTSLMYEFASLDRPVIALNAPWYRRDVHHGLRYWELVPGVQVDEPGDLLDVIDDELENDRGETARDLANAYVCPLRDGRATERAVRAILDLPT